MKLRYIVCVLVAVFMAAGFAEDAAKPYVRLSAGTSMVEDSDVNVMGIHAADAEFATGFALNIAAGLEMADAPVRGEIELGYSHNDLDKFKDTLGLGMTIDDGEIITIPVMLNGYLDIENDSIITPYITAGIGGLYVDMEHDGDNDDDFVIAGQLGIGLEVAVNETVAIDAGYRYLLADDAEFSDDIEMEIAAHRVQLGVRIAL